MRRFRIYLVVASAYTIGCMRGEELLNWWQAGFALSAVAFFAALAARATR